MYDAVMQENLWKDFMGGKVTDFIDYDYKAKLEDDILKIHIPEKIPPIKKEQATLGKRITNNISRIVRKYKELFYDKYVMVIIKIYDDTKIWDADNRNYCSKKSNMRNLDFLSEVISLENLSSVLVCLKIRKRREEISFSIH